MGNGDLTDQKTPLNTGIVSEIFHDCPVFKEWGDQENLSEVVIGLKDALKGEKVRVAMVVPDDCFFNQKLTNC